MCSGNHYCFNDNDNKIVQPPIFRMAVIIIIVVQKRGSRYASRMRSKLFISADKGNIIEGTIQK